MSDNGIKLPPYTPIESLGHELGIMFGFLAACIGTVGLYFVIWQGKEPPSPTKKEKKKRTSSTNGFNFWFASHPTPRR
jgi:hypothetical protein